MGIIVLALCLGLVVDVSWKWKFIVVGLLASTFLVPVHLAGTDHASAARICALVVQVLLAIVYLIRLKMPAGFFD